MPQSSVSSYSASNDVAGSMTRCSDQVLGYDALRRLITWQNQATNPTQTASYAYNGEGRARAAGGHQRRCDDHDQVHRHV